MTGSGEKSLQAPNVFLIFFLSGWLRVKDRVEWDPGEGEEVLAGFSFDWGGREISGT